MRVDLKSLSVGELRKVATNFYGVKFAYKMKKEELLALVENIRSKIEKLNSEENIEKVEQAIEESIENKKNRVVRNTKQNPEIPKQLLGKTKSETIRNLIDAGWKRQDIYPIMKCSYQQVRLADVHRPLQPAM